MDADIAPTLHPWLPNVTILRVSNADHLLPLRVPGELANTIVDSAKGSETSIGP